MKMMQPELYRLPFPFRLSYKSLICGGPLALLQGIPTVVQWVINNVDTQLSAASPDKYSTLKSQMWTILDEEIALSDCDVYRYEAVLVLKEHFVCTALCTEFY